MQATRSKILPGIAALALVIGVGCGAPADEPVEGTPVEQEAFGDPITLTEVTPVSAILDAPEEFLGERVLVEGTVVEVCEMRGCWMDIASDREYEKIQIKVDDGVIVFPPEIVGETVIAEGVWTANELTLEQTKKVCAAEARKEGEEFDEAKVTNCMTLYQLSGTGAVVLAKAE